MTSKMTVSEVTRLKVRTVLSDDEAIDRGRLKHEEHLRKDTRD